MCKVCIDGLYSARTAALQHSSPFTGDSCGSGYFHPEPARSTGQGTSFWSPVQGTDNDGYLLNTPKIKA